MPNRTYTARETRWVAEYVATFYPEQFAAGAYSFQVAVGPLSQGITKRAAPRADAIIFQKELITIIEAETENISSAMGQLELYRILFPLTPGYEEYAPLPIRGVLLLETFDSTIAAIAAQRSIAVDTWAPPWLLEYLVAKRGAKPFT